MAFPLSPSVNITEQDFTNIIPAVATSTGAYAGVFEWGPVLDPVSVTSEEVLTQRFGHPNDNNFSDFFSAANFLSYSNDLLLTRVDVSTARNAVTTLTGTVVSVAVDTGGTGYTSAPTVTFEDPDDVGGVTATGYAVLTADAVSSVVITNPGTGYSTVPTITFTGGAGTGATATATTVTGGVKIKNVDHYEETYSNGAGTFGEFAAKYPGALGNSITVNVADSATFSGWTYEGEFTGAPGTSTHAAGSGSSNDEMHIVIVDTLGLWTGTVGTILEKFAYVSKASGAKKQDGSNNYYKDVLNTQSKYIWWTDHPTVGTNWGTSGPTVAYVSLSTAIASTLTGGLDSWSATDGERMDAFELFADKELYDISLVITGKVSATVANFVISNVAETRKDIVAFISPINVNTGDIIMGRGSDVVDAINAFRNALPSTSYAFMDTGFKYQYDRYNDVNRWVPLNSDIAGLAARTDYTNDAWWSFAGYNRGQIKNWIKLATQLGRTERDHLYQNGVNPVVIEPGQGCILFGDKTLQSKPSAFDRVNVRRLFIVLEKAISKAAKYQLFEFNDEFTRSAFVAMVTPFLRDVQGRRGINKFVVKCDETNNTTQVISSNNFVGDIYIQPNYSINFITLNFIATNNFAQFNVSGA